MDKTKENLRRIRAYDAEEEWKTIKGSHVLVKMEKLLLVPGENLMERSFMVGVLTKKIQERNLTTDLTLRIRKD